MTSIIESITGFANLKSIASVNMLVSKICFAFKFEMHNSRDNSCVILMHRKFVYIILIIYKFTSYDLYELLINTLLIEFAIVLWDL